MLLHLGYLKTIDIPSASVRSCSHANCAVYLVPSGPPRLTHQSSTGTLVCRVAPGAIDDSRVAGGGFGVFVPEHVLHARRLRDGVHR